MKETIDRYLREGWHVSVNRERQVIFTNPNNGKFFVCGVATEQEREYIKSKKVKHVVRIRKRFIHRRERP